MNVVERFLKYVSYDTQSDPDSKTVPSTLKQLELAKRLVSELEDLELENIELDKYGVVYATLPANDSNRTSIGFIAHMDTSPDMSGENVKPKIISKYNGETIVLNKDLNITMSPKEFSSLSEHIGHDLIVTDGKTLLGADDKAGIAEIMAMLEYLVKNSDVKHGDIQIAFTPDEEIGRGTDHFDVKKFGAAYAYTVDGGSVDSIDYENFNAASAHVEIKGSSIHPGDAKNKMLNALTLAMEFHSMLPVAMSPEHTEGNEGFYHLTDMSGACEYATMDYIIRDHDKTKFHDKKQFMNQIEAYLNKKYQAEIFHVSISDSYYNMRECFKDCMYVIDQVKTCMKTVGLSGSSTYIRGGTDGARLSYEGLPCPNLGTGGYNYHGKYEYVSIQEMEKSVKLLIEIVKCAK